MSRANCSPERRTSSRFAVLKNATPGSVNEKTVETTGKNGGALGADNPTFHSSVGWDWIPTIRGRNSGIWSDVWLSSSGPVTVDDPFVKTTLPLPDTSSADVSVDVTLRNHDTQPVTGTLRGRFGDMTFEQAVTLGAFRDQEDQPSAASAEPEALVAQRVWRAEPLRLRGEVRNRGRRYRTRNPSRPACASSPTAKKAAR